jgi:sulfur-carrier protein
MTRRPLKKAVDQTVPALPQAVHVRARLGGPLMSLAGGATEFDVEAATIQDLLHQLGLRYPLLAPLLAKGVNVAINGTIFRASWHLQIPPDAEVYILPPMQGG